MHQLISKKVIIYLCVFFLLATVNNSSIINIKLPIIEKIKVSGFNLDQNDELNNTIKNLKSERVTPLHLNNL